MSNGQITITQDAKEIVVHFPIDNELPLTTSGKGRMICSTHGKLVTGNTVKNKHNAADNNVILNCNLYVRATDKAAIEMQAVVAEAKAKAKNE